MKKTPRLMWLLCGAIYVLWFMSACGDKKIAGEVTEKMSTAKSPKKMEIKKNGSAEGVKAEIADMYGVPADMAVRYVKALEERNAKALVALGREALKTWSGKSAVDKAAELSDYQKFAASAFREAASMGSTEGMMLVGWCAANGVGGPNDLKRAFDLYLIAGEAAGYNEAARILISGKDGAPDPQGAMALIDKALAMGSVEAKFLKGTLLFADGGDGVTGAMELLMQAARADNADAQALLARMYKNGEYVPRDERAALEWLKFAADLGLASANANFATMTLTEETSGEAKEGVKEAMDRLIYAAGQGNATAACELAKIYRLIQNPTQDEVGLMWKYAQQALDGGNGEAALLMAISVPPVRVDTALEWLKKGADVGDWRNEYAYQLVKQENMLVFDAVMMAIRASRDEAMRYASKKAADNSETAFGDRMPSVISAKEPVMPAALTTVDVVSTLCVQFVVDQNGIPQDVTVIDVSPYEELNRAAVEAVKEWRFNPGYKNGKAVKTRMVLPICFHGRK